MKSKLLKAGLCSLILTIGFSGLGFSYELSLNGLVPVANESDEIGWTMGIPIGGHLSGNHFDLYAGYWAPSFTSPSGPRIAADALIFPTQNAAIIKNFSTNISWQVSKITDDLDGTNVLISKILVYQVDSTNEIAIVTNNIPNIVGKIPWISKLGFGTNYVVKFEVVDSLSITNSRIFWDNPFTVVPEPAGLLWLAGLLLVFWKRV